MLDFFMACLWLWLIVAPLLSLGLHTQAFKYRCRRTRDVALTLDIISLFAFLTLVVLKLGW